MAEIQFRHVCGTPCSLSKHCSLLQSMHYLLKLGRGHQIPRHQEEAADLLAVHQKPAPGPLGVGEEALVLQPLPLPPAVLELIRPGPGAPRDGGGGFQGPARGVEAAPPLQGPQPAQQAGGGGGGGGGDRGREPRPPVPLLPPHSTGEGETTERVPAIQFDQSFGICFYYPHLAPGTGPRPVELIIKNCNEKVSIISRDSFNNLLVW